MHPERTAVGPEKMIRTMALSLFMAVPSISGENLFIKVSQ
jgi:hypothetical protein